MNINCISKLIDEDRQQVRINVTRKGKRQVTTVIGINDQKGRLKRWKVLFACNGFLDGNINLQGDQVDAVYKFLIKEGFDKEQIVR